MDIDPEDLNHPQYIMSRPKSCPCCRSLVRHRPAPIFMVKDVAAALLKAKPSLNPLATAVDTGEASVDLEEDPWDGIFPPSDEELESDEDTSDEFEDAVQWAFRGYPLGFGYDDNASDSDVDSEGHDHEEDDDEGRDSEEDEEDGDNADYVPARWGPPSVEVDANEYEQQGPNLLNLLRRGCSWSMIRNFRMEYTHTEGIVAHVQSIECSWGGTLTWATKIHRGHTSYSGF
ncbi:hypothetical protein BDQ12DRAFT_681782 [Crucibulum laeve]|uniref:DUF8191 domain-containing protein n=1 Tax=Crucibulum laeve TaxID=68775 RepID=A0A5C3ME76_9AGAR|nr:hypothetical protein BDQ12DRAFT_681782 [Crucibulum laeve]